MEVGQKVYLKPVCNMARGIKDSILNHIKEKEIVKKGRKYFEVGDNKEDSRLIKFYLENHRQVTNYSADWEVYFSMQEILDEVEFNKIAGELYGIFGGYGKPKLTLDQLRKIKKIVDSE